MTGHIFIEGEIGTEVTAKTVRDDIANYPQATNFVVHINSPGGNVYEGYQIGSIIKNLGKPTVAQIGAMCASIATYTALSCDTTVMNPHGDFMIHLPTGNVNGTADDLRVAAVQLDRIKSELIDRYMPKVARKGVTRDQVSAMMEKETSMSPKEALDMGFIDDIQEKLKAVAKFDANQFKMENTFTKEEAKGMFAEFGNKITAALRNILKTAKNLVDLTLEDGTKVYASDVSLVGATITYEDGKPLPAGQYNTQDGQTLTVDAESKITQAEPMKPNTEEAKKLADENAALKAQLEAALKGTDKAVADAVTKVTNEQAKQFQALKKEFEDLKKGTFGDATVDIDPGDKTKDLDAKNKQDRPYDPMAEWWDVYQSRHN